MLKVQNLVILCTLVTKIIAFESLRGVSFAHESLYQPKVIDGNFYFKCLTANPEHIISYVNVNDNYCDCPDGSDEPGTSACSPFNQFYCENSGYIDTYLSSIFVDDGICDCCDGSDEISGLCSNTCRKLSDELKERNREKLEKFDKGSKIRLEYLDNATITITNMKTRRDYLKSILEPLKLTSDECLRMKQQLEAEKKKQEEKLSDSNSETDTDDVNTKVERIKNLFTIIDKNNDGNLDENELQPYSYLQPIQKDILRTFYQDSLAYLENDEEYYKKFTDFLHQNRLEKILFKIQTHHTEIDEYAKNKDDSIKDEFVNEKDNLVPESEPDTDPDEDIDDETLEEDTVAEKETNTNTDSIGEIVETQDEQLNLIRKKCDDDLNEINGIENEIRQIEQTISGNFGDQSVFLPLKGNCFVLENNDYIYHFCPFDKVQQEIKHSNEKVNLGVWNRWQENYSTMVYDRGQKCWNGPDRSVFVQLMCGVQNQVITVSEPSRCEYRLVFETPASCDSNVEFFSTSSKLHDEL